ncbi:amidohydrolase family protein [Dyadobacter frigoris]|uniref:Twin-arginine translocation signal domain-containing protein n=1 Tax=Dyadobacter frigoris TaxID=2576211 RepID=A0A4V6BKE4_9BACT|nr:amidohydrolase family protein [Dyadobacter frigoris]TKT92563.1 twin-arginine translocation signal domain-containing protein [Dyadobacter frigoris]GLU53397.1 hypothetical protein Dfri01_28580 [Dyadobacter frigoris]
MSVSRRDFIKKNTLAGLALAAAGHLNPLFGAEADIQENAGNSVYFDGYTRIGPRKYKHPAERWSLGHLQEEMNHCSISGALVASTLSVNYDAMFSNLELSGQIRAHANLFAIWNVMPHQTGEFPDPVELGKQMKLHNVRAVSLFPHTNEWDWKDQASHELLNWLSKNKILTIVNAGEFGGMSPFNEFLTKYPSLPVYLINASWSDQRYVLPMVASHRNLHVGFDNFQINEGIEYFYRKGYIDQAIFGSNSPTMSAGAHRAYMDYADIPAEARAKATGGNLTRLLHGLKPPETKNNPNDDILMEAVKNGKPIPVPLIDMHMHMLNEGLNGAGWGYRMENGGPDKVFRLLKRLGYDGGGIMSWNGVVSHDAAGGNISAKKSLDLAPPGYWGLANFDPTHYSQEELKIMIPKMYEDKRFIGMKPYHYYGVEYQDPSYDIWWEYGNKRKFYGLLHNSRSDLFEAESLAKKYPDVRWVIAHAGGSYQMADMAIAAMKKFPNIYAEITLTPVHLGIIEYLVAGAGEDRILYGSDLPMRDPRQQLGWVIFSRLSLPVKKKILAGNALKVIEPCLADLPAYNRPKLTKG